MLNTRSTNTNIRGTNKISLGKLMTRREKEEEKRKRCPSTSEIRPIHTRRIPKRDQFIRERNVTGLKHMADPTIVGGDGNRIHDRSRCWEDYARAPREYFPRPAQSHPDWKRRRRGGAVEEQRRGTKPIMRVTRVEFVTVLHCSPTQTGTRWMRLMGGREGNFRTDRCDGSFCARLFSFPQTLLSSNPLPSTSRSMISAPRTPCSLIASSFFFSIHLWVFLCAPVVNGKCWRARLTHASDNWGERESV